MVSDPFLPTIPSDNDFADPEKKVARAHDPLLRKDAPESAEKVEDDVPKAWSLWRWIGMLKDAYGSKILLTIVLVSHLCVSSTFSQHYEKRNSL